MGVPEERAAGGEYEAVSFGGVTIADQSDVQKVLLLPNIRHSRADIGMEIIPLEAVLFSRHG
jgi:hypothetical protein